MNILSIIRFLTINIPKISEQEKIAIFLSLIDKKIELMEKEIKIDLNFKKNIIE